MDVEIPSPYKFILSKTTNLKQSNNAAGSCVNQAALALIQDCNIVKISGADARQYLHFRSTNHINDLQQGQGLFAAFLDKTAHVQAMGSIHYVGEDFFVIQQGGNGNQLIEVISSHLVSEDVKFELLSGAAIALQGPALRLHLTQLSPSLVFVAENDYDCRSTSLFDQEVIVFSRSFCGLDSLLFYFPSEKSGEELVQKIATQLKLPIVNHDDQEAIRVSTGHLKYGIDVTQADLVMETGLEHTAVSYDKGCYLGQEVVARVKTYSSPKRSIVGLEFSTALEIESQSQPTAITIDGKTIGDMRSHSSSFLVSPSSKTTIAIASLDREHRNPEAHLDFEMQGKSYCAQVKLLPFIETKSHLSLADELYDQALKLYTDEKINSAIHFLEDCLTLNPKHKDAYEVLGVILSKTDTHSPDYQSNLDKAITLMKKLEELEPDNIMAHTNLSIFYMQQGLKELAEEEKAKAMSIQMQQLVSQMKEENEEDEAQIEIKQRLHMFEQVLALDPDDMLANNGAGECYVQLGQWQEALPHLEKAIKAKPSYTQVYLNMTSALSGLKEYEQALVMLEVGMRVAAKNGDMMPLKQMQGLKAKIESKL